MLKRHKSLTILMTLCLCMALLAPVFIAPPAAQAATVTASGTPTVSKTNGQNLGSLIVDFGVISQGYHQAVIKLPDGFVINDINVGGTDPSPLENQRVSNMAGANCPAAIAAVAGGAFGAGAAPRVEYQLVTLTGNQLQFTVYSYGTYQEVKFGVSLSNVDVPNSAESSINATVIKLNGDFPDTLIPVAKTSGGAVDVLRTDPPTWSAAQWNATPFAIHVREDVAGGLAQGASTLKIKLPKGFSWNLCSPRLFPGNALGLPAGEVITGTFADPRVLVINRTTAGGVPAGKYTFTLIVGVTVDENEAVTGDVIATISGSSTSNMSELKLGSWADYGYSVTAEKPETEVVAGMTQETISKVVIKENIAQSLLNGRSVIATLPSGVQWPGNFNAVNKVAGLSINFVRNANDFTKATGTIVNGPAAAKGECWLDKTEINVAVDYTGPIEIQFSGSGGINDKVAVAKAVAPITASAEKKDVKIGVQAQAAGNITITETKAEAIKSRNLTPAQATLFVEAPFGVTWAKLPTVKVAEGDLTIGTVTRAYVLGKHQLQIPIRSQSTKATKLEISDVYFTVDRTVPEGDLNLSVGGDALDQANIANRTTAATVAAANCITPAPDDGTKGAAVGQFKIGSNIYEVNGVAKVMDAAPYIKGDRTYVPVRYLGYALGVAEADVVWDAATQKVTLTKGDNVVELTIGSTTITVNGEAKTMDVAPEITSDRTMLPARYVAEGLGYVVGWDPGSKTILISK